MKSKGERTIGKTRQCVKAEILELMLGDYGSILKSERVDTFLKFIKISQITWLIFYNI